MFYLVGLFLLIVGATAVIVTLREISLWVHDNRSPFRTVEAKVVVKYTDAQRYKGGVCWFHLATFALDSGEKIDFIVSKRQSEMLKRGDMGLLTFQGTRFKKFVAK